MNNEQRNTKTKTKNNSKQQTTNNKQQSNNNNDNDNDNDNNNDNDNDNNNNSSSNNNNIYNNWSTNRENWEIGWVTVVLFMKSDINKTHDWMRAINTSIFGWITARIITGKNEKQTKYKTNMNQRRDVQLHACMTVCM